MSTYTPLIAFRLKSFICRTTVKILIHIKFESLENCSKWAKGLTKASQQTSKLHPIETTSVCKTVQHVSVFFFKKLAYN